MTATLNQPGQAERVEVARLDQLIIKLVYAQQRRRIGKLARLVLRLVGVDIGPTAKIGPGLLLPHSMTGVVIHPDAEIGRDVTIFQGVTVGRSDMWLPRHPDTKLVVGDGVILGAGSAVLVKAGERLEVGAGTVIGANSVLTRSTGENEIWAGSPARRISSR